MSLLDAVQYTRGEATKTSTGVSNQSGSMVNAVRFVRGETKPFPKPIVRKTVEPQSIFDRASGLISKGTNFVDNIFNRKTLSPIPESDIIKSKKKKAPHKIGTYNPEWKKRISKLNKNLGPLLFSIYTPAEYGEIKVTGEKYKSFGKEIPKTKAVLKEGVKPTAGKAVGGFIEDALNATIVGGGFSIGGARNIFKEGLNVSKGIKTAAIFTGVTALVDTLKEEEVKMSDLLMSAGFGFLLGSFEPTVMVGGIDIGKAKNVLREYGFKNKDFKNPPILKTKFKETVFKLHPDKGGNPKEFKTFMDAYNKMTSAGINSKWSLPDINAWVGYLWENKGKPKAELYQQANAMFRTFVSKLVSKKSDSVELSPQSVMDIVINSNLQNTKLGKIMLKQSLQARQSGQNVEVANVGELKGDNIAESPDGVNVGVRVVEPTERADKITQAETPVDKAVAKPTEGKPITPKSQLFTGKQIAQEAKDLGSDQGGLSDFTLDKIRKEDYKTEDITIDELRKLDPDLDEYLINTSSDEIRDYEGEAFGMNPIVTSSGEVLDGYNRIHQHLRDGENTITILRGEKKKTPQKSNGDKTVSVVLEKEPPLKGEVVQPYDPSRLEKKVMPPNTMGNPSDQWQAQIRYKGFAADKKSFNTKKQAEEYLKTYKFEGLSKSVAEDYAGTPFDPFPRVSKDLNQAIKEARAKGLSTEEFVRNKFIKKQEPNLVKSPYYDLTKIQEGVYNGQNVGKTVAKDAEKLLEAIYKGDVDTISKIAPKYENAFLTFQKSGLTRDRFIPTDVAKVRLYDLSNRALREFTKTKQILTDLYNQATKKVAQAGLGDIKAKPVQPTKTKTKIIQGEEGIIKPISKQKIENAKNIKDIRIALKSIRNELSNLISEAEGRSVLAQEQREGINTEDVGKLKRIYARSKKYQEGDIETIRSSNSGPLLNRVIENIQEKYPEMTEDEAFNFALELPTKADERIKNTSEIKTLADRQKTLSKYLDILKDKQKKLKIKEEDALYDEWKSVISAQEKLARLVEVPREQLPVGEGKEVTSKLEARIKKVLKDTDQETIDKLGLSTFNQMNRDENIAKAVEYITANPKDAMRVLTGEIEAPPGILRNSIFVAMQENAAGDVELARKLASLRSTRFGQELSILAEIDPDSPVKLMNDIIKVREKVIEKRYKKTARKAIKDETAKIKKNVKKVSKYDWNEFIKSIEC